MTAAPRTIGKKCNQQSSSKQKLREKKMFTLFPFGKVSSWKSERTRKIQFDQVHLTCVFNLQKNEFGNKFQLFVRLGSLSIPYLSKIINLKYYER